MRCGGTPPRAADPCRSPPTRRTARPRPAPGGGSRGSARRPSPSRLPTPPSPADRIANPRHVGAILLSMDDRRADQHHLDEWMHWQPVRSGRFASLFLTPARATGGVGALMAIVAGFMPWAQGSAPAHNGFEEVFFSGLAGQGDGVVLILVSLGAGLLTVHRTPATSRVRLVRILPAVLVVLAALTWLNGFRASLHEVAAWERRGGSGAVAPGLWLAGLGIVLMAAGTIVLLPAVIRC